MFTLKRIINGRLNVSEPLSMASGVSAPTTFKAGTVVTYDDGMLKAVTGDVTAEYVVAADTVAKSPSDEVLLILITKEMLFDCPVSATPTGVAAGKRFAFSDTSDGITATPATEGGAYIVCNNGATAAGDIVTVRLA